MTEEVIPGILDALKAFSPATEQLYLVATKRFYNFLAARKWAEINLPRLNEFILQQARRPGRRLPQFPRDDIEKVHRVCLHVTIPSADPVERLRDLRDRAFLLALADTGLRVHEACGFTPG